MINLNSNGCVRDTIYPLFKEEIEGAWLRAMNESDFQEIVNSRVGDELFSRDNKEALFKVMAFSWQANHKPSRIPLLKALLDIPPGTINNLSLNRSNYSLAVVTLSDKGSKGLREDKAGPEIINILKSRLEFSLIYSFLIADDIDLLKGLLSDLAFNQKIDLILTTGGTGISERDITPQATGSLLDLELPGIIQAMMSASIAETPNAMLSRAKAGLIGPSLIINLPGSVKAVRCNLRAILNALPHALVKARGDNSDCGGE